MTGDAGLEGETTASIPGRLALEDSGRRRMNPREPSTAITVNAVHTGPGRRNLDALAQRQAQFDQGFAAGPRHSYRDRLVLILEWRQIGLDPELDFSVFRIRQPHRMRPAPAVVVFITEEGRRRTEVARVRWSHLAFRVDAVGMADECVVIHHRGRGQTCLRIEPLFR